MTETDPFNPSYHARSTLEAAGFAALGQNVRIARTATIIGREHISLGDNVRIDGYVTLTASEAGVVVGRNVHLAAYAALGGGGGLELGDFCGISQGVKLFTRSDDYSGAVLTGPTVPADYTDVHSGKVRIDRHAIIGAGSVILPAVTVGEGAAVGALSLILRDLDPWMIYAGVPARALKARSRDLLQHERAYLAQEAGLQPPR